VKNEEIHWIREDLKIGSRSKCNGSSPGFRYRQPLRRCYLESKRKNGLYVLFPNKAQKGIASVNSVAWYPGDEKCIGFGALFFNPPADKKPQSFYSSILPFLLILQSLNSPFSYSPSLILQSLNSPVSLFSKSPVPWNPLRKNENLIAINNPRNTGYNRSRLLRKKLFFCLQLLRDQIGQWVSLLFNAFWIDRLSGVLLFSSEKKFFLCLKDQFMERTVKKLSGLCRPEEFWNQRSAESIILDHSKRF